MKSQRDWSTRLKQARAPGTETAELSQGLKPRVKQIRPGRCQPHSKALADILAATQIASFKELGPRWRQMLQSEVHLFRLTASFKECAPHAQMQVLVTVQEEATHLRSRASSQ